MEPVTVLLLILGLLNLFNFKAAECRVINENNAIGTSDVTSHFDKVLYVTDDDGNKVPLITSNDDIRNMDAIVRSDFLHTTSFMLYTRSNPVKYELLRVDDNDALLNSHFNPELPTRLITHGWMATNTSVSCTLIRDAYLKQGDYNIIVFDWSRYSKQSYFASIKYVKPLAIHIGEMINFLVRNRMDPDVLTLIGHSLGAHIVGLTGYFSDVQIHHIVGLDPALPMFGHASPGDRISVMDAKHIEIIHTDGGYLGFQEPIGHFDFYPNGGTFQVGCGHVDNSCAHSRSYLYYAESITSDVGFYAYKCDSYEKYKMGLCDKQPVLMGHRLSLPSNGSYFLDTNDNYPFAKGPNKTYKHFKL